MSPAGRARMRLPLRLVAIDVVGAVTAGLGIYGLVADVPPAFAPALGDPANAWLLVVLGAALMGYAVVEIVRLAAKAARENA
ncbi:MAG: hypothetical protein R3357_11680 [Burkholderiales bacterium]|nr:hypothetical protein [Burkholderiales bacterium]